MATQRKTKIDLIIEKSDGHFWGRIEGKGFMPTGQGKTIEELKKNVIESIIDYVEHEGKGDKFWSKLNLKPIQFDMKYDLQTFFKEFEAVKINSIARIAGINESLLRQYVSGKKYPSADQVEKIGKAIKELANKMSKVALYAA
jgi:predicted RNase H-like HicB family nuclease